MLPAQENRNTHLLPFGEERTTPRGIGTPFCVGLREGPFCISTLARLPLGCKCILQNRPLRSTHFGAHLDTSRCILKPLKPKAQPHPKQAAVPVSAAVLLMQEWVVTYLLPSWRRLPHVPFFALPCTFPHFEHCFPFVRFLRRVAS